MTQVTEHPPGRWCWMELATADPEAAKAFYGDLLGWEFHDTPAGPAMVYTFIRKEGDDLGALYAQPAEQRQQGVRPHWLPYVSVRDADAVAARADELGGRVVAGPFDVGEAGRSAFVADPQGATFGLWQAKEHGGAQRCGEPGTLAWTELRTGDPGAASRFYSELLGWRPVTEEVGDGEYTEWKQGEVSTGGMMALREEWGPVPPHWGIYIQVDDVDSATERAAGLGSQVRKAPTEIEGVGRFSLVADPQGAGLALIELRG